MVRSRRGRVTQSCDQCQRRKIRCDHGKPCSGCRHARKRDRCTYSNANTQPTQHASTHIASRIPANSTHSQSGNIIRTPRTAVDILGTESVHESFKLSPVAFCGEASVQDTNALTGGSFNKARYFGPSHWLNGTYMFPEISRLEYWINQTQSCEAEALERCKVLARAIKAARSSKLSELAVADTLPRDLCDTLLDAYIRTFGTIYRILHIPTFLNQYRDYWAGARPSDDCFTAQLQLCLAIGGALHDRSFSLRSAALRWIRSAQVWLESTRLSITKLQVMCLVHIAGFVCKFDGGSACVSVGFLVRSAMALGLHRDPIKLSKLCGYVKFPKLTLICAETRRRVWATVVEIAIQASIESGLPSLISTDDFDCQPPGNFNDDQLIDANEPSPWPSDTFTQSSLQIILFKSSQVRLRILKLMNGVAHPSLNHAEALRLDEELAAVCRSQSEAFRFFLKSDISPFQIHMVEFLTHRFYFALHLPFIGWARSEPIYYYSQKMLLETGLKLYRAGRTVTLPSDATTTDNSDFCNLFVTAAGPFSSVRLQSVLVISSELAWRLESQRFSLIPTLEVSIEEELCKIVKDWMLLTEERIKAGETTVKERITSCCFFEKVKALQAGQPRREIQEAFFSKVCVFLGECHGWLMEQKSITLAEASKQQIDKEFSTFDDLNIAEASATAQHSLNPPMDEEINMGSFSDSVLGTWFFYQDCDW